ncbi:hypothetical protein Chor_004292 [Crotalus horridus]
MNELRKENKFCDVTVCIDDLQVHGHKIVFAAGSPFLRDQFLLNDSREVKISILQSSEVGRQLLLSCYSGVLEFPEMELVNYLTAASFLQMSHIVERCTEALWKFIRPKQKLESKVPARANSSQPKETVGASGEGGEEEEEEEEEDNDDEEEEDSLPDSPCLQPSEDSMDNSDIQIVKVESIGEVAEVGSKKDPGQFIPSEQQQQSSLPSSEPQHSLINSTVENRVGDLEQSQLHNYALSYSPADNLIVASKELFGPTNRADSVMDFDAFGCSSGADSKGCPTNEASQVLDAGKLAQAVLKKSSPSGKGAA